MDTPKLKNIIIIILLLLNAFLLAIMVSDNAHALRERRLAEEKLKLILGEQGVELSDKVDLRLEIPAYCTVARDMDKEQKLMQSVIGADEAVNQGGNIYYYDGKTGQAVVRATGETDIMFSNGGGTVGESIGAGTEKLFKKGKLLLAEDGIDETGSWTFFCTWDGYTVYNARLTASFSGDTVQLVSGTMVFGTLKEQRQAEGLDCPTALMRFLQGAQESGYVYNSIENVSVGYIMSVSMPGECSLKPVWCIETDTGTVFTNGETGRIENISK